MKPLSSRPNVAIAGPVPMPPEITSPRSVIAGLIPRTCARFRAMRNVEVAPRGGMRRRGYTVNMVS